MARERLENRRLCETLNFECNGLSYSASIGRFPDGRLAEIFLSNSKAGSHSDAAAKDSAVVASLALQHGVPLDVLASLLAPFHVISTTVHPPGLPHGKGYRRTDFEGAWKAYCPGQNHPSPPFGASEAGKRATADEMGTTHDFRGVREDIPHGSKNGNLSYCHAGLHACTDPKPENGAKGQIDQEKTSSYDRHCDYCGGQFGDMNPWNWPPDRPTREILLHQYCEQPWWDSGGLPEGVR